MLPRRGPHVFVEDLATLTLADDDLHHLRRVLRLRDGDDLTVGDGRGRWQQTRFGDQLVPTGDVVEVPPSATSTTVAFALVKGGRPELVVQKLTELGIDRIIPFSAERSVVRWDDAKTARNHVRLTRVAREASMQSKRVWLPAVEAATTFAEVAGIDGAVLADFDADPWRPGEVTTVLVGPEGGWSDAERNSGLTRRQLGSTVLRAETAAIAVGVLLTVSGP